MQTPPDPWAVWHEMAQALGQAWLLAMAGVGVGIGQLLYSDTVLRWRLVIGRALTSGGLGMAAGSALVWVPDLSLLAQLGIAAALASLGTSGLERVFERVLTGRAARREGGQ